MSILDDEYEELMKLMEQTTANLNRMAELQKHLRIQFGESEDFINLVDAIDDTRRGWVSSNC